MSQKRISAIYFIIMMSLAFLCVRLYALSQGNDSRTVLTGQYTRRLDIAQRSGFIYDRNLDLLSHRISGVSVTVNPDAVNNNYHDTAKAVSEICNVPVSEVYSLLSQNEVFTLHADKDVPPNKLSAYDGIYINNIYEEFYSVAPHILGYKNSDGKPISGLVKAHETALSAFSGRVYAKYEANAVSKSMNGSLFEIYDEMYTEESGVVTTLDKNLQEFTQSLGESVIDMGAIIITDVNTGEILALSSFPSYDSENIAEYLESDRGELINRACARFTPGSVFKLVVAAAALEKDMSLSDFSYECTGSITTETDTFRCHKQSGHSFQTLSDAFANSCNTYFIELGRKIGADAILETADKMGLGKDVFADFLHADAAQLFPESTFSENLLANVSFGQGPLLLSPLDMVNVTNCASTGLLPTLSLIKGIYKNGILHKTPKTAPERVLSENTCKCLRDMMKKCVSEGTGQKAYLEGVSSGGKTATAQTGQLDKNGNEVLHTWFCGIYPCNSPKYSIIILCDGNGRNTHLPAEIFAIVNKHLINCGY